MKKIIIWNEVTILEFVLAEKMKNLIKKKIILYFCKKYIYCFTMS